MNILDNQEEEEKHQKHFLEMPRESSSKNEGKNGKVSKIDK